MNYEQTRDVLRALEQRFDWEPIMEGDYIIGVRFNGQSVSLEPGGQFELSGAPLENLHQTCAEVNSHLYQVGSIVLLSVGSKRMSPIEWQYSVCSGGLCMVHSLVHADSLLQAHYDLVH